MILTSTWMRSLPIAALTFALGTVITPAAAESPAEFYKGKTITIMLGHPPGGSYLRQGREGSGVHCGCGQALRGSRADAGGRGAGLQQRHRTCTQGRDRGRDPRDCGREDSGGRQEVGLAPFMRPSGNEQRNFTALAGDKDRSDRNALKPYPGKGTLGLISC